MGSGAWSAAMFVSAATFGALLTCAWIALARARQLHDLPGQRRLHLTPTPRGGGIAIAIVFAAAAWLVGSRANAPGVSSLAVGVGLFSVFGLLDDLLPIPALVKFILQLLAALVLVGGISRGWATDWLLLAGSVLLCAYTVNIWNFMDGSNGLIATQALLVSLALAFWPGQSAAFSLAALALAGACLGFLPFNFPSARVFLGDIGSHAIGAAMFGLLLLSWHAGVVDFAQVLMMSTVVLLDTGFTLARRMLTGRRIWRAHRDHLYQYAVRKGHSHARVCLYYAVWTGFAILLALISDRFHSSFVTSCLLIFSWLFGTLVYFGLRRRWLDRRHKGRGP
jgi:UDP-N-acetylmuramyl pentapeptide phosphotransferase/UDP-N-acetylglucosamine-1-phosphate transferase